ncbi:PWWP domain-containing protein [Cephalotus follicularis]|uniref:PWWP domain-containing protein n=1 Tax=Cephalotus follicularis TaxID=3775 RepID=A0A1Q3B7N7_CEPFO|nr:PWWP domain-containing protein [Cephalotus follicularis]
MENPQTPETLEPQNLFNSMTQDEECGPTGFLTLNDLGIQIRNNGEGFDIGSENVDVDISVKALDGNKEESVVMYLDTKVGLEEDSLDVIGTEKGSLVNDGTERENEVQYGSMRAASSGELLGLDNNGSEGFAEKKDVIDTEMIEGNRTGLNKDDSVRNIEVSRGGISLFVDFSDPTTVVNQENLHKVKCSGSVVSNEEANVAGEVQRDEVVTDDQESRFCVGDIVWVKTKTQTWWPGKIYNPSNASEYTVKRDQKDCLLVGYFGSSHVTWCCPSQLKPFHENFDQMSGQNKARIFLGAVEKAVDEFGKHLKTQMTCSCILKQHLSGNKGVSIPECKFGELGDFSITRFQPATFLANLKSLALAVSNPGMLEFTVALCRLSAFYRSIGHSQLPMHQLQETDDAESADRSMAKSNTDDQDGNEELGLAEEKNEELTMILGGELVVLPEKCRVGAAEEGIISSKRKSHSRKMKSRKNSKVQDGTDHVEGLGIITLASPPIKGNCILGSPRTTKSTPSNLGNGESGCKAENVKGSELRERKKSKYLSYPYVSLEQKSLPSEETEDAKAQNATFEGVDANNSSGQNIGPPAVKSSGKRFQKKWFKKFIDI